MKIGIDIGGSHIATGIVLDDGNLIGKETRDINVSDIKEQSRVEKILMETIENEIKTLLNRYDYKNTDISEIGIAVPGSPSETSIRNLVNLHIDEFNLSRELKKIYSTEIQIRNDGKCAGIAEKKYGALQNYDDCVFLCIGTGVGSAVFLNGQLLKPKQNPGFELGHVIIEKNGRQCNCGKKGCFEAYASMKRFKNEAITALALPKNIQSEELQRYIRENINNENVDKYVDNYLENFAIGLSNIINIFEPEAVCFGGSFSYYDDIFLEKLELKTKKYMFNKNRQIKLVVAKLKNDAGIIGATVQ